MRDLPSSLDYKDQSLTVQEIQERENTRRGHVSNASNAPPSATLGDALGDLPSSMDYKDQGLTPDEVRARHSVSDLPSSIDYKDQGMTPEELRNRQATGSSANTSANSVVPNLPTRNTDGYIIAEAIPVPHETETLPPTTPSSSSGGVPSEKSLWKRPVVRMGLAGLLLAVAAVAVVVALRGGSSGSGDSSSLEEIDPTPTLAPSLETTPRPSLRPTTTPPTLLPTLGPTAFPWQQLGPDLEGPNGQFDDLLALPLTWLPTD
jgi:hypothetical protein